MLRAMVLALHFAVFGNLLCVFCNTVPDWGLCPHCGADRHSRGHAALWLTSEARQDSR